jgi:hypothetical protein
LRRREHVVFSEKSSSTERDFRRLALERLEVFDPAKRERAGISGHGNPHSHLRALRAPPRHAEGSANTHDSFPERTENEGGVARADIVPSRPPQPGTDRKRLSNEIQPYDPSVTGKSGSDRVAFCEGIADQIQAIEGERVCLGCLDPNLWTWCADTGLKTNAENCENP